MARSIGLVVCLGFLLAPAGSSDAAEGEPPSGASSPRGVERPLPRQELEMRFTTARRSASTGTSVSILFRDPANPDGKPIPVRRERFSFPKGTRFAPTAAPACDATELELLLLGESACPPDSRVGGGTATAISGSPFDPVAIEIDAFENGTGFSLLATAPRIGVRFVAQALRKGRTLTVDYPRSPGGPPDGETALREVHNLFDSRTAGSSAYVRTPRTCPPSGRWRFVGRFTYADGVTETAASTQRCRKPPAAAHRGP